LYGGYLLGLTKMSTQGSKGLSVGLGYCKRRESFPLKCIPSVDSRLFLFLLLQIKHSQQQGFFVGGALISVVGPRLVSVSSCSKSIKLRVARVLNCSKLRVASCSKSSKLGVARVSKCSKSIKSIKLCICLLAWRQAHSREMCNRATQAARPTSFRMCNWICWRCVRRQERTYAWRQVYREQN